MPGFKYRMQNILDIKIKLETQAKNEFAMAAAALREEEEKLQNLEERRIGYIDAMREAENDKLNVKRIIELKNSIETMKSLIRTQMFAVQKAQRAVEAARAKLNAVMQERKTHENLKERDFEIFKKELAADEAKQIDQLVSFTYNNKDKAE